MSTTKLDPRPLARCKVKACPTVGGVCGLHGPAAAVPRDFAKYDRMVRERPHHGGDRLDDLDAA